MEIVAGDHDTFDQQEDGEQRRQVCRKIVHHRYTGSVDHDFALLELCDPLEYNPHVQPIALAPRHLDVWEHDNGPTAIVAGWGTTRESGQQSQYLRAVEVHIVDLDTCHDSYSFVNEGHICAGEYAEGGKDSCQGDSGGALWWQNGSSSEIFQVGIVSLGNGCARRYYPGVYGRVSECY